MTHEASPPASPEGPAPEPSAGGDVHDETAPNEASHDEASHDEASHREASPEEAPPEEAPPEEALSKPSALAAGEPPPAWRPNYVFLAVVAIASLGLDLATKAWAKGRLEDAKTFAERHIDVIHDHVMFVFAKNRGGAWGLLQDEPESIRRPFFLGISVVAVCFIVWLYRKLTPRQWALKWGLPLVLGGALGNFVNRIQYNYVVDFIDFSARWGGREHHWPTFNVADIAIVVGVALMALDMFTPAQRDARAGASSTRSGGDASPSARPPEARAAIDPAIVAETHGGPSSEPAPKET